MSKDALVATEQEHPGSEVPYEKIQQTRPIPTAVPYATQPTQQMPHAGSGIASASFRDASQRTYTGQPAEQVQAPIKKKSKALIVVLIIASVLVIAGIVCAIVFFGPFGTEEADEQEYVSEQSAQVVGNPDKTSHTVIFDTDGGTSYESIEAIADDVITEPPDPIRYGYTFDGWYLDKALTNKVSFPYKVKQDDPETIVFYAGWKDSNNSSTVRNPSSSSGGYAASSDLFPQSSSAYLTRSDLYGLSLEQIQRAINEIYARNGYIFQSSMTEKEYFESQPWYVGTETDMDAVRSKFNQYEKANEELLAEYRNTLQ